MNSIYCSVDEQHVNPLLEVFDGGDLCLSSSWDVETKKSVVEIFFPDVADKDRAIAALVAAGEIVGVKLEPEYRSFPDEDWKFSYRKYFHVDVASPRIVIRPPWEEYTPTAEQHVITIDPGMAFGTGKHETTHSCLEFIDRLADWSSGEPSFAKAAEGMRGTGIDKSFLDMGTGSGILAFAAAKLGFEPVEAFDIDADAVKVAIENAEINGVNVKIAVSDLSKPQTPARYVVANILGPVLIHFAANIATAVKKGEESRLVLSGILDRDYHEVRAAFEAQGFKELETIVHGEWRTGLFAWA